MYISTDLKRQMSEFCEENDVETKEIVITGTIRLFNDLTSHLRLQFLSEPQMDDRIYISISKNFITFLLLYYHNNINSASSKFFVTILTD